MQPARSIFITGGGSGIGRAAARLFAARGWQIGLADIDPPGVAETVGLLPPGSASVHPLDVRDRAQWDSALAAFEARSGRIDVVFNNAGVAYGGALIDLSDAEIDQLLAVNLHGAIHGARAAFPYLARAAPGSCLLNTASAAALYGTGGLAVYSATKFAIRALTEALDGEWHATGVRVRSLMPDFVDTPLLAGPANAATDRTKRARVIEAGLPFTPVERVAEAAWTAIHGERLHTPVGKTAGQLAFAAKWAPGYLRRKARIMLRGLSVIPEAGR